MAKLTLVPTPLGNLEDMPLRAIRALKEADIIYCEDTRHSRPLLTHFGIEGKKLSSLHEHNESARIAGIIENLQEGLNLCLISDAGMPVVSDPGQRLVDAVIEAGFEADAIPGPNAALTALVMSGFPSERFSFEGFLPASGGARKERLAKLAVKHRTTILYESPHRLKKTLADLAAARNEDSRIFIARELTKLHQETWRGPLSSALIYVDSAPPRGEYTLVLEGTVEKAAEVSDEAIKERLNKLIGDGRSQRDAIDIVSTEMQLPRKRVYAIALKG